MPHALEHLSPWNVGNHRFASPEVQFRIRPKGVKKAGNFDAKDLLPELSLIESDLAALQLGMWR